MKKLRFSDSNEKNISMKNLEKIIKLLIRFNEIKKKKKRKEHTERKNMFMKNRDMKLQE